MDLISAIVLLASLVAWLMTRHPFFSLPALVAVSLLLEDDAYPFSHFPMYSNPDESENYLYLATPSGNGDGELEPLAVRTLTGITAPKIKKMFNTYRDDYADGLGKRKEDLSDEDRAQIGREILAFFREQGEKRRSEMPDELVLVEVWINYNEEEGGFTETPSIIARQRAGATESEEGAP